MACGLGIAGVAGGVWVVAGAGRRPWLAEALRSRLSLLCLALIVGCGALLAVLGALLWRVGARGRGRTDPQGGAAMVEFVLALPILLGLVLVMLQSSLLMGGNMCVHYASYCAARSAVVQIPRQIDPYEPTNELLPRDTSTKLRRVHQAAVWAVMPVSPSLETMAMGDHGGLPDELPGLFLFYGQEVPGWLNDRLGRRFAYAAEFTHVEIDLPAEGGVYGADEDIRVRVRHTFRLAVPYAGRGFAVLSGDGVDLPLGPGEYGLEIYATCTLPNEGAQNYVDRERFP